MSGCAMVQRDRCPPAPSQSPIFAGCTVGTISFKPGGRMGGGRSVPPNTLHAILLSLPAHIPYLLHQSPVPPLPFPSNWRPMVTNYDANRPLPRRLRRSGGRGRKPETHSVVRCSNTHSQWRLAMILPLPPSPCCWLVIDGQQLCHLPCSRAEPPSPSSFHPFPSLQRLSEWVFGESGSAKFSEIIQPPTGPRNPPIVPLDPIPPHYLLDMLRIPSALM